MMNFFRFYHVSCVNFSFKKQGIKLSKMVNPKAKRQWYPTQTESATLPSLKSLTKLKHDPGKRGLRRTAMLNKMFMKQITDLMSTGTVAMDIVGRGIEISKVKVSPDFQTVNVFWVCKGDGSDAETDVVLGRIAGALRHELSTLRLMGEIPYIVFVKDKQEAHLVDLDRRLANADYGEEYTPTDLGHLLKSEFTLNTKLSPEVKAKIKQLEEQLPIVQDPIPEMSNNIYGLDYAKITNRLLAARKKTKDAWDSLGTGSNVISYRATGNQEPDAVNQRKEIADFLLKRQILQNKLQKEIRNARKDWQMEMKDDKDAEVENEDEDELDEDEYDLDEYNYFLDDGRQPLEKRNNTVV